MSNSCSMIYKQYSVRHHSRSGGYHCDSGRTHFAIGWGFDSWIFFDWVIGTGRFRSDGQYRCAVALIMAVGMLVDAQSW